jgi:peroxiredoxin
MGNLSKYRVLIFGILSPFGAVFLHILVYGTLTHFSPDLEKDWMSRLAASALVMTIPFFNTLWLAVKEGRQHPLTAPSKIGLFIAFLSLGLILKPLSDGVLRFKQSRNLTMHNVAAPLFDTPNIFGKPERLADHKGEVVLVNVWATWCEPCRREMPKLDQLYRERKDRGLVVFGLSDETVETQRRFLEQIPVTYPLLTVAGQVPNLYRDIVRYPAIFLIDRNGRLQPAPGPNQPFEKLAATVDSLMDGNLR